MSTIVSAIHFSHLDPTLSLASMVVSYLKFMMRDAVI